MKLATILLLFQKGALYRIISNNNKKKKAPNKKFHFWQLLLEVKAWVLKDFFSLSLGMIYSNLHHYEIFC